MNDLASGILIGLAAGALIGGLVWLSRRQGLASGRKTRLLANQYQIMMASGGKEMSADALDSPALALSRREFRQIEAIEAELVHEADSEVAIRLLKSFLKGGDPWVAARAAWALYRLDAESALSHLKTLLNDRSPYIQLPAIWALGQLGTPVAVNLLIENVGRGHPDTQRAALRSLVQIDSKKKLPPETSNKIQKVFAEARAKSGWVL